jgi:ketosteroid isomerase-like protein
MAGDRPEVFNFQAYRLACETKDAASWIDFFADDAEWLEYRNQDPPSRPRRLSGKAEIREYVDWLAASPLARSIENELVGTDRVAFRIWTDLRAGLRVVEHVMLEIVDGKIHRQVDVEAWDLMPRREFD